jgi:hypothetical protein
MNFPKDKLIIIVLGILFLLIAIPRLHFPDLDHGDEWADADVLTAAQNFAKFGFIKTYFLPFFEPQFETPKGPYTHYPPFGHIFHGLLMMLFKTESLYFFRGLALFFSFLNLLLWYLFIKKVSDSRLVGFLCGIFLLTNPLFIYGMDSLNQPCYSEFLRTLILFSCLLMSASKGARRTIFLSCIWVSYLLLSLWTYEYIIYIFLFLLLFKYLFIKKDYSLSWKHIFIIASAPVVAFLLHFLQNSWYFGSPLQAFQDLRNSAAMRILHSTDAPSGHLNFPGWFKFTILRNFSLVFSFNYLTLFLAALFSLLLFFRLSPESRKEVKALLYLFIILSICGVSWYVFFPSHSIAHAFVNFLARHLVPAASVGFGLVSYIIFSFLKENNPHNLFGRFAFVLIVIIILFTSISKSELPVSADIINKEKGFVAFKNCLLKLKGAGDIRDEIGVNYYRNPFMRYYTHKRCIFLPDRQSLENMQALPRYFIFVPYADQRSAELLEFLKKKYAFLFRCESTRFPSIFCELRK